MTEDKWLFLVVVTSFFGERIVGRRWWRLGGVCGLAYPPSSASESWVAEEGG